MVRLYKSFGQAFLAPKSKWKKVNFFVKTLKKPFFFVKTLKKSLVFVILGPGRLRFENEMESVWERNGKKTKWSENEMEFLRKRNGKIENVSIFSGSEMDPPGRVENQMVCSANPREGWVWGGYRRAP